MPRDYTDLGYGGCWEKGMRDDSLTKTYKRNKVEYTINTTSQKWKIKFGRPIRKVSKTSVGIKKCKRGKH